MAQESLRAHNIADGRLLEQAQVFSACLNGELNDFTARFPWLDAAWAAAFEAEIAAANTFPTDVSLRLDIGLIKGDLKAAMQRGYAALRVLEGYAILAWPTDLSRQRAFGQPKWRAARANAVLLAEALELAHGTAQDADFKPLLFNKGYAQDGIDELQALMTVLSERNTQLMASKADRKVRRHDRVLLLKAVWERMTTLSICAKVVWAADAARQTQYQRYKRQSKTEDKDVDGSTATP